MWLVYGDLALGRNGDRVLPHASPPPVEVGDEVVTGQIIGLVGNSGHSSGPHLHLEAHVGRPAVQRNPLDPVACFRQRGVDLANPAAG
ncbi:M23 family metallopeptidase [Catellatospora methionotrophica]|uniref:M23 family metallopeptidase n=1 Tax=Catellatospora methionotrophica TaxID=121620 RepID=UPI0033D6A626